MTERNENLRNVKVKKMQRSSPVTHKMNITSLYIYVLAFFSGMSIMAVELCASRLMAPFFGTSTFVWTNIIGIIMIDLSIGYIVGGKLADRKPRLEILLKLLLAACLFLLVHIFRFALCHSDPVLTANHNHGDDEPVPDTYYG
jgi:MFS family permease